MTSYWGLNLSHGDEYKNIVEKALHITAASINLQSNYQSGIISLIFNTGGKDYVLCNLSKENLLTTPLNLVFQKGEEISFSLRGSLGEISLSGFTKINNGKLSTASKEPEQKLNKRKRSSEEEDSSIDDSKKAKLSTARKSLNAAEGGGKLSAKGKNAKENEMEESPNNLTFSYKGDLKAQNAKKNKLSKDMDEFDSDEDDDSDDEEEEEEEIEEEGEEEFGMEDDELDELDENEELDEENDIDMDDDDDFSSDDTPVKSKSRSLSTAGNTPMARASKKVKRRVLEEIEEEVDDNRSPKLSKNRKKFNLSSKSDNSTSFQSRSVGKKFARGGATGKDIKAGTGSKTKGRNGNCRF